jgi:wyosine [tRNA(Phe)-imidazoG37] synthetase (radical SAM superfamily)
MLHLPEVRHAAALANVVKVSLSAWNQSSYGWVNRPHRQLQFDQLIEGQKTFRAQFKGQLWMEVFLVGGINSIPNDVRKIAAFAKEIGPDRIHLNTAVRPPAEDFAAALTRERMEELIHLFHPTAEIITEFSAKHADHMQVSQEEIFSMLKRRPCTANQIGKIFGMHFNEVSKYLGNLIRNNQIRTTCKNTSVYYAAINSKDNAHI